MLRRKMARIFERGKFVLSVPKSADYLLLEHNDGCDNVEKWQKGALPGGAEIYIHYLSMIDRKKVSDIRKLEFVLVPNGRARV